MILDWLRENGPFAWTAAGLALLALELAVPGAYLMWIGLAAVAVGLIGLFGLPDAFLGIPVGGWDWQAQAITFAGLALLFAVMGRHLVSRREAGDGADALARPARRLVGRTGPLVDAIEGGIGRVRLGDTLWRVEGPDAPAGTRVTVTGERDGALTIVHAAGTDLTGTKAGPSPSGDT